MTVSKNVTVMASDPNIYQAIGQLQAGMEAVKVAVTAGFDKLSKELDNHKLESSRTNDGFEKRINALEKTNDMEAGARQEAHKHAKINGAVWGGAMTVILELARLMVTYYSNMKGS